MARRALLLLALAAPFAAAADGEADAVPPFLAPAAHPPWIARQLGAAERGPGLELTAASVGLAWMHANGVTGVAALDDGGAVSVCAAGRLQRWDARGRSMWTRTVPAMWADVAVDDAQVNALVGTREGSLLLVDLATGRDRWVSPASGRALGRIVADPALRKAVVVDEAGEVSLWDLAARTRRVLEPAPADREQRCFKVALAADGSVAAAGTYPGLVKVWRLDGPQAAPRVWQGFLPNSPTNEGGARSVALTADGARLLGGGGHRDPVVKLWDARTGELLWESPPAHRHLVSEVLFHPDGRRAVSASFDGTMRLWDLEARRSTHALVSHATRVIAIDISPDGRRIVSSGSDGRVLGWDAATGKLEPGRRRGLRALATTPDGRSLVTGCNDGRVERWDLEEGTARVVFHEEGSWARALALTPAGAAVVGTSTGAWLVEEGKPALRLVDRDEITAVGALPSGDVLTVGRRGALVRHDAAARRPMPLLGLGEELARALDVSSRGRLLLGTESSVQVLALRGGAFEVTHERTIPGPANSVALSPDGRRAVVGWPDRAALLDPDTGARTPLQGASNPVALAPGGRRVATGTAAGDVLVWDVSATPRLVGRHELSAALDKVEALAFQRDDVLFVGTARGALLRLRVAEE